MRISRLTAALSLTTLLSLVPGLGMAQSFHCISDSSSCTAANNLSWSLSGRSLIIKNNAADASFIRSVHFDNGSGMSVLGVTGWTGSAVAFRKAETMGENVLPGGLPVGFFPDVSWTAEGSVYRDIQKNGVGAGESITFDLTGVSEKNLINGTLRVGVQLEGLTDTKGGYASISLVTVPKPGTYVLLLGSLFGGLLLLGAGAGAVAARHHRNEERHA